MNMIKYDHFPTLRGSNGLFPSQWNTVHQTTHAESHRVSHHRQSPQTLSSYGHSNAIVVSHYFHHPTPSNRNRNHIHSQLCAIHTPELVLPLLEYDSPLDYRVTVKGREVISADVVPVNQRGHSLSNLDLLLPPIEFGVYFCYKKKDNTDMSPETVVKTIKKSLAGVLSSFHPLAGEIVPNGLGEPEVVCNNSGVEFIHAHADVELKDLDFHQPDQSVSGKLVPKISHGLLSVQATELKCGSIIISCAVNHQLTDGYSLNMFLLAWAKYTQSKTISNIPSFRSSFMNPRIPPHYEPSLDDLYIPISSLPPPSSFEEPLDSRMYYIRAESIERIQSKASTKENKRSKLLSFTAYLWKLLAIGGEDDVNAMSRMGIVVNGRRYLTQNNKKNLENHYGNVLSVPYGVATNSDLKAMPLHEVANRVHEFVSETTNEEHFKGLIDWVQLHRPTPAVARIYFGHEKLEGGGVVVSSGQGLPIMDMDFGWGKPVFGSYHVPWGSRTGYVTTMPSASRNGDWVVYMHLKEKELYVIDHMASNVFTPISIASFL